jgi:Protein of unknown function (DUF1688)
VTVVQQVLKRLGAALLEHPEYFERNGISRPGNLVDYLLAQVDVEQLNSMYDHLRTDNTCLKEHCLMPHLVEYGSGDSSSNIECVTV